MTPNLCQLFDVRGPPGLLARHCGKLVEFLAVLSQRCAISKIKEVSGKGCKEEGV
jgi:hypothetical protein